VTTAATVNAGLRRSPRPATIRSEIMRLHGSLLQFCGQPPPPSYFAYRQN
jgi:hypothetical protein